MWKLFYCSSLMENRVGFYTVVLWNEYSDSSDHLWALSYQSAVFVTFYWDYWYSALQFQANQTNKGLKLACRAVYWTWGQEFLSQTSTSCICEVSSITLQDHVFPLCLPLHTLAWGSSQRSLTLPYAFLPVVIRKLKRNGQQQRLENFLEQSPS